MSERVRKKDITTRGREVNAEEERTSVRVGQWTMDNTCKKEQ